MIFATILVASICIQFSSAAVSSGPCPKSPTLDNFNPLLYAGSWYEIEKFEFQSQGQLVCVKADYGILNSTAVSVTNSGFNPVTENFESIEGWANILNLNEPNKLQVTLLVSTPNGLVAQPGKYDVWDTDYTNYSLVYSCNEIIPNSLKIEFSWILARSKTLSQEIRNKLKSKLAAAQVDVSNYVETAQTCAN